MKYLSILLVFALVGCQKPTPVPVPVVPLVQPTPAPKTVKVIAFTMRGCEPCKQMKPVWEKLHAKVHDVHKYPVLAQKYQITECPTTIMLENDVEVKRVVGYQAL